jgi:FkbM family methyltransferase
VRGLSLLRRLYSGIRALDRADWPLFRRVPSVWKRRLVRAFFRSADSALTRGEPVELEGLRWSVPDSMRSTFVLQSHEPGVRRVLERLLRPGMVVVDVGANIGYHTVFAASRVQPGGKVFAVEADADNLAHLRENLRLNGVEPGVVEVLQVAAGAVRRRRSFHRRPDAGHHGLYPHPTEATLEIVEVEERPLDELIEGPVDVVKIDVEAGELEVLEGMERILAASPEIRLVVEWNPPLMAAAGLRPTALPQRLAALGFEISVIETYGGTLRLLDRDLRPPEEEVELLAMRA